jgi:hypothetical protein
MSVGSRSHLTGTQASSFSVKAKLSPCRIQLVSNGAMK